MQTDLITAALTANIVHHRYGHTCEDGQWHNPNTGTRTPCPPLALLRLAETQLASVKTAVHDAAHQDSVALVVGSASVGFTPTDLQTMTDDDHRGLIQMGRYAIEALSEHLDRDPHLEDRAAAALNRLAILGAQAGLPYAPPDAP